MSDSWGQFGSEELYLMCSWLVTLICFTVSPWWCYLFGWGVTFQTPVGLNIQNVTKFQQAWTWESCAKHLQSDLLPQNRKGHFFPLTPLGGFIRDLFKGLLVTSIWVMHPGRGWKMRLYGSVYWVQRKIHLVSASWGKKQPTSAFLAGGNWNNFGIFAPNFWEVLYPIWLAAYFSQWVVVKNHQLVLLPTTFRNQKPMEPHGWFFLFLGGGTTNTRHFMNGYEAHEAAEKVTKKAGFVLGVFFG